MKRIVVLCTLVVFTTLMLLSACTHEQVVERQTIRERPPAPSVVVLQSQRPATWVPGYWIQSGNAWTWRSGHWE
jgi:hypothetical protein